jgi:hypothetical protein
VGSSGKHTATQLLMAQRSATVTHTHAFDFTLCSNTHMHVKAVLLAVLLLLFLLYPRHTLPVSLHALLHSVSEVDAIPVVVTPMAHLL